MLGPYPKKIDTNGPIHQCFSKITKVLGLSRPARDLRSPATDCASQLNPPNKKMKAIVTFISAIIPLFVLTSPVHAKPSAKSPNKVADAKWFTDFKEAKKQAAKEERPIFLFFTGSDWCPPCKVIKAEIFSTELFKNAVKDKWVLVEVDLPNDESKIEAEILEQNKLLQGYFEITSFPTVLALNSDGKPLANIPRYNDPAVFVLSLIHI